MIQKYKMQKLNLFKAVVKRVYTLAIFKKFKTFIIPFSFYIMSTKRVTLLNEKSHEIPINK
jgi:hypothetical protein